VGPGSVLLVVVVVSVLENIHAVTGPGSATTPMDAVTLWAAEAKYYDYASNTCSAPNPPGTCLHYTQVVWRDTTAPRLRQHVLHDQLALRGRFLDVDVRGVRLRAAGQRRDL
jgi:hypothetical protein